MPQAGVTDPNFGVTRDAEAGAEAVCRCQRNDAATCQEVSFYISGVFDGARLKDDPATAAVRAASNAYGIRIPDDGLAEIGATYSALRRAVERVLEADPAAFDIAVTFGPAPAGH